MTAPEGAAPPVTQPASGGAARSDWRWLRYAFLFFLGWVMMYADRSILAPVQDTVREQFGVSNATIGLLSSVFFIVYVATQIPSGILGDRVGRIRLIFVGFLIFGVATALTGVAGILHIFGLLFLMRAFAGFGEGLYYGPQYAKSGEETPLRFRALGAAIINSGQGIGTAAGILAATFITYRLELEWGWTFVLFGGITLVVGVLIRTLIPDSRPSRPPGPLSGELRRFGSLLRNRVLLGTFVMLFCGVYAFFVMVTWLPTFLTNEWSMDPETAGQLSSVAFWVAVPAGLLVGHLSDRIRARRPFVVVLVPVTILAILAMAFTGQQGVLIAAIALYGAFGKLALDPVLISVVADNITNEMRSTAYGLYNCIGMAAAILAPYVTGALVDATGAFQAAFLLSAVLLALGATVFLLTFRERATPVAPREESTAV